MTKICRYNTQPIESKDKEQASSTKISGNSPAKMEDTRMRASEGHSRHTVLLAVQEDEFFNNKKKVGHINPPPLTHLPILALLDFVTYCRQP